MDNLVRRSDKVAFYGVPGEGSAVTYHRMRGFTEISRSANPIEYSRQYIDEDFERNDVTGYSPSISYAFDQFKNDAVHTDIVALTNDEKKGAEAVRKILIVDLSGGGTGSMPAVSRDFAVIPDSEGDSTDAYTYSGTLKVSGDREVGTASSTDGWTTCTFSAGGQGA